MESRIVILMDIRFLVNHIIPASTTKQELVLDGLGVENMIVKLFLLFLKDEFVIAFLQVSITL